MIAVAAVTITAGVLTAVNGEIYNSLLLELTLSEIQCLTVTKRHMMFIRV